MKKIIPLISICSLITIINGFSQSSNAIINYQRYIENEQVISENKLEAHASFTSYTSEKSALTFNLSNAEFYKSLDGLWKFSWVRSPKDRPTTFMNPSEEIADWQSIKVPANWEVEGFGIPIYVNHQYEFADFKAPLADDI